MTPPLSRRDAVRLGLGALGGVLVGCPKTGATGARAIGGSPRLFARPRAPSKTPTPGLSVPNITTGREAFLYVPAGYRVTRPAPLVLMFHGAGGFAYAPVNLFQPYADGAGLILLSVGSRGVTWDAIHGDFDVDVPFIDKALDAAFDMCAVDPARVSVEGFSDGATYALAVGRANGSLFSRVAAFSAGVLLPVTTRGKPAFFISHGAQDSVIAVDNARRIVTTLQADYDVTYREFEGGHSVPPAIAAEAAGWLAAGGH